MYLEALSLFKECLGDWAFFGRGASLGPRLIMTDDAAAEIAAIG